MCREICTIYGGTIARTGGDEFIGFFPGYSIEQATAIANEFRLLLASKFTEVESNEEVTIANIPFTAAIGITSLYDQNGSHIQVRQKYPGKVQTNLQKSISIALKKADLMAKAAKDASN